MDNIMFTLTIAGRIVARIADEILANEMAASIGATVSLETNC